MDYKLFSLAHDFSLPAANEQQLCVASNMDQDRSEQAVESIFQLPQKSLALSSGDLASFWKKLG